jgi:hypothetical protein
MGWPLSRCRTGHTCCHEGALARLLEPEARAEDSESPASCPRCAPPPPPEFVCPITHALMEAPAVARDGFTYERAAIEDWLRRRAASPRTNEAMEPGLVPNFNLRALIAEWRQRHAGSGQ